MLVNITLPVQTAGGTTSTTLGAAFVHDNASGVGVGTVFLTSPVAVTGAATNNFTVSVRQLRNGTPVQTIASFVAGAGNNLAVETPVSLPVTATQLLRGDAIDVQLVQNGTGLAVPAGLLVSVSIN